MAWPGARHSRKRWQNRRRGALRCEAGDARRRAHHLSAMSTLQARIFSNSSAELLRGLAHVALTGHLRLRRRETGINAHFTFGVYNHGERSGADLQ